MDKLRSHSRNDWIGFLILANVRKCRHLAIKSQPVPQFVRPKLDVGPFVKLGDRIAAGHGRELCALM